MGGRHLLAPATIGLGLLLSGCSDSETFEDPPGTSTETATTTDTATTSSTGHGGICTVILYGSVELTVVDDLSGAHVCDATVSAVQDGQPLPDGTINFTVETLPADTCLYRGRYGTTGTIQLLVEATGYDPGVADDVALESEQGCDAEYPDPAVVEVRLT